MLNNMKNDIEYIKFRFEEMNIIDQSVLNTNNKSNNVVSSKNNGNNLKDDKKNKKKSFFGMVKSIFK
jgi:hypothetical protein